jgi:multiple sugar transport system permease protein
MTASVTTGGRRRIFQARRREAVVGLALVSPAILGFLIFNVGPIVASFVLSFTDYNILSKSPSGVGFDNYARAFSEELFRKAVSNTLYYTAFRIPLSVGLAFLLATLLRNAGSLSKVYRAAVYLPNIVPTVGAAVVWIVLLNPQFGLVNRMLALIGIQGPGWLTSPVWSKPAIILIGLTGLGGSAIIFLAGLHGIPPEYYEAASVDGAGFWRHFWSITVPLMTPTVLFNLVMESIYAFQIFETAFIATGGGPLRSTYFMALYIYDSGFRWLEMGYASALAWMLFVAIMAFTLMIMRSSDRWVFYGGGR